MNIVVTFVNTRNAVGEPGDPKLRSLDFIDKLYFYGTFLV